MSQAERLIWIDSQIRAGNYPNAAAVRRQFEVSRRTAYVDYSTLVDRLGAPIAFDHMRGGWHYTEPTFMLPALTVSDREAAAIQRALLTAREYLGPADAKAIERIAASLSIHLPRLRDDRRVSASGAIHAANVSTDNLVDDCLRAIDNRQKLHIRYYGAHRGVQSERTILPYHLHNHQGEWHLVAHCENRQDIRQFLLARIGEWTFEGKPGSFSIPDDFSAKNYLAQGFGARHGESQVLVVVRFSVYQARWIRERIWHPSQELIEREDGGVDIRLTLAGTAEIKRWILGYGAEAEVLEPEPLRREIEEEVVRMKGIYVL